jgi:membrane complex biogenesis BtpA family protein
MIRRIRGSPSVPQTSPMRFSEVFRSAPLIGVIHLPPLPGFDGSPGIDAVLEKALADQQALEAGGIDGVLVENEEDHPHEVVGGPATIAHMTRVTEALVARGTVPVGVEILLNDAKASLAVAAAAGARFIRTDYFIDRMERADYGEMHIDPVGLLAFRRRIGADHILVLADIQVKYARMLEPRTLAESASVARASGADAVVVTGTATGQAPSQDEITEARRGASGCPILIGSGLDVENAARLLSLADGAIVGTSLKSGNHVDLRKVQALVAVSRTIGSGRA